MRTVQRRVPAQGARLWCLAFVLALSQWAVAIGSAAAAEVPWSRKSFVYDAQDKPLRDVLQDFAASQSLTAVISSKIDENVNVHIRARPADAVKLLGSQYGLIWYYDGTALYFYKSSEMESKLVRLNVPAQRFIASLKQLGIAQERFPVVPDQHENVVLVNGPRRYVELVEEAARTVDPLGGTGKLVADEEVRVFPLRYAWAQDKTVRSDQNEYTIPGVAATLRKLFAGEGAVVAGGSRGGVGAQRMRALTQNRSITSELIGEIGVPPPPGDAYQAYQSERPAPGAMSNGANTGLPQIHADGRMNAVVIRDSASRMPAYAKLIEALDKRPLLIEIEARIIDVLAQSGQALGVRWQGNGSHFQGSFDGRSGSGVQDQSSSGVHLLDPTVPGAIATVLIGNDSRNLILTVNALEQDGKARVLAAPRVLTLDNVEAHLANTETYYVRVAGNLSAELFKVTAGTQLKVTPLATVDTDGARRVKLAISVEDGAISSVTVDNIPVVQRRNVDTQALVREGDSLLIGGLVYEQDASVVNAIPVLGHIPVLGALFRHKEDRKSRIERLFMITPRVIEVQ